MRVVHNLIKTLWVRVPEKAQKHIISFIKKNSWIPGNGAISESLKARLGYKELREYAYYLSEHFEEEVKKISHDPTFVKIDMDYHVGFYHAGIVIQVIEYTVAAMQRGLIPVFFINDHIATKDSLCLEWFYDQPYETVFNLGSGLKLDTIKYSEQSIDSVPFKIESNYLWDTKSKDWKVWKKLATKIISKNINFEKYVSDDKARNGIKTNESLGVIIRGTDYVKLRPRLHPVQPEIDEIVGKVRELMHTGEYASLYIATDEKRIFQKMVDEFGENVVFANSREYYDEIYRNENLYQICEAKRSRDNDQFLSSVEYISSMSILADCKGIVGGNCTGSLLAALLGDNSYVYIFNKGLYE